MKTTALIFAAAIALSATAVAGDKTEDATKAKSAPATKPAKPEKVKPTNVVAPELEKNVAVTGSYIKRDVRRNGLVTDGSSPMYVLDNKAIQNSGAATVSELLMRRGLQR